MSNVSLEEIRINESLKLLKFLKYTDNDLNLSVKNVHDKISECKNFVILIVKHADAYSFDDDTHENGYKSIIQVFLRAVDHSLAACEKPKKLLSVLTTKSKQLKNINNWCDVLSNFVVMLRNLHTMQIKTKDSSSLIADVGVLKNTIVQTLEDVNLKCFYNQNAGFHHSSPSRHESRFIIIFYAAMSHFFYSGRNFLIKIVKFPLDMLKYALDADLCGERMNIIYRNADVDYYKTAYNLFHSRISCFIQNLFSHNLKVNKEISILPEPLQIESTRTGNTINIEVPQSHIGIQPIRCNLYSSKVHFEMNDGKNDLKLSKHLIIHIHGGGFFGHTPYSHECYLREWAVQMNVPILSVNYSLVPEAPYPRALEEIFYVYCWILKTSGGDIGLTAKKILVVGDSAGAHLNATLIIKCIEMGIPVPKGFLSIYGLFLANFAAIPSRMLGMCDIVLNYGSTMRILRGYAGFFKKHEIEVDGEIPRSIIDSNVEIPKHHYLCPILASDDILRQFPPTAILSTNFDPCLDEDIEMAKKLRSLDVNVKLVILPELVHGFLHGARMDKRSYEGSMTCVQLMKQLLEIDSHKKC